MKEGRALISNFVVKRGHSIEVGHLIEVLGHLFKEILLKYNIFILQTPHVHLPWYHTSSCLPDPTGMKSRCPSVRVTVTVSQLIGGRLKTLVAFR